MSTFAGFSEEDLKRMKLSKDTNNITQNYKKNDKIGIKQKNFPHSLVTSDSDKTLGTNFDKCKLSFKIPPDVSIESQLEENIDSVVIKADNLLPVDNKIIEDACSREDSTVVAPDVIKYINNYTEDELEVQRAKLEELQLKQKIMEEQNKKRKEMLSKALADRTKQTEEEVLKLEKIKKELEVLDNQLTKDVAMLRKKIDQACVHYSDAEKQYLKVENEFLQAKINLHREKEKKELLIEHLCTLITHNETRKAEKLETLMLELANGKNVTSEVDTSVDDSPVIIDGVDERTGKMVEYEPGLC